MMRHYFIKRFIFKECRTGHMASLLIRNGRVYDHRTNSFAVDQIFVEDGVIASIGEYPNEADEVVDAEDLFVTPGLIDMHCHVFTRAGQETRLPADRIGIGQGVTCVVDTGSAGGDSIDEFRKVVLETQTTSAFALCNIGSPGKPGLKGGHAASPGLVSIEKTVNAIERNRDYVLGVKVLASSSHSGLMGIDAVKMGRKAAELTGTPLMVHIGNAPPVIEDILALLRPGDILTHSYHGKPGGVLGYQDRIIPEFRDAVERGIVVDIAHGRASFSFRTCEKAMEQGMPVHTISSDLHRGNIDRYVVSLARTMSKFRMLGLSMEAVVRATTVTPAEAIGLDTGGFGRIEVGQPANISLLRETDEQRDVEDAEGEVRQTASWIEPVGSLIAGVYHACTEEI